MLGQPSLPSGWRPGCVSFSVVFKETRKAASVRIRRPCGGLASVRFPWGISCPGIGREKGVEGPRLGKGSLGPPGELEWMVIAMVWM